MIPHVTVYIEKAAAPDALADGAGSRVGTGSRAGLRVRSHRRV